MPRLFEVGEATFVFPITPQEHYRRIYFEAIDLVTSSIQDQFEQRGFRMLVKLETLITTVDPSLRSKVIENFFPFTTDFSNPSR